MANNRTSLTDRKKTSKDPMDALFNTKQDIESNDSEEVAIDENSEKATDNTKPKDKPGKKKVKKNRGPAKGEVDLTPKQYYLTDDLIKAIELMKAFEGGDYSIIVRDALYKFIPKKYLDMAKEYLED
jgi:hypothetical protein